MQPYWARTEKKSCGRERKIAKHGGNLVGRSRAVARIFASGASDLPLPSPPLFLSSSLFIPSLPFSSRIPILPPVLPSPNQDTASGERCKLPHWGPQTYFDAFTALKTHLVATSFIRLYEMQMTAFCSSELVAVLFLCSEKHFLTFWGFQPVNLP